MYHSQEKTKLDAKSRKCIFLGHADNVKGYRLWDPTTRKIIFNRDIIVVEDELQKEQKDDKPTKETAMVEIKGKSVEDDEENEPNEVNDVEPRRITRPNRKPSWQ